MHTKKCVYSSVFFSSLSVFSVVVDCPIIILHLPAHSKISQKMSMYVLYIIWIVTQREGNKYLCDFRWFDWIQLVLDWIFFCPHAKFAFCCIRGPAQSNQIPLNNPAQTQQFFLRRQQSFICENLDGWEFVNEWSVPGAKGRSPHSPSDIRE